MHSTGDVFERGELGSINNSSSSGESDAAS
jgi:hypothetical protein